ncbi:hypothetical protein [Mucilaginibacter antarcticus]|uniref:hypothetical protein n=1 Tax=Mucilaginibacter antarcticus TaxID=1855725 RepID=UPI003643A28E
MKVLKFSADNLLTLINDVLDFTKIETGNIDLEQADVDLRVLVQSIAASLQYQTKEKIYTLMPLLMRQFPKLLLATAPGYHRY